MKKTVGLILALIMAFSLVGCKFLEPLFPKPTEPAKTEDPSGEATAAPTEAAAETAAPTDEATPAPTEAAVSAEDEAFLALDLDFFREQVTASISNYNQYIVSDPAKYGIDRADVDPTWGELTYDAHKESIESARDYLARLGAIDPSKLTERNANAYEALKCSLELAVEHEDFYYYDEPLEPLNGLHTMLPLSIACFNIRCTDDVESYLRLVEDIERLLGQVEVFEAEKAEQGLFMCETALDQVVESCRGIAEKGSESMLITYFEDVIEKAKELGFTDAECEALRSRNTDAVMNHVLPAYSRLADTLESHRGDCTPFVGAVKRGEMAVKYFELKVKEEGASLDDLDTIFDKIETMGADTFYELSFAVYNGPDDLFDKFGDTITFGSIDDNLVWLKKLAEDYYPAMPEYDLKYINVPEDIAEDFSPAAYLTASFDDYNDNLMLINPTSEGSDDVFTIAHEAIPGHMYQYLYTRDAGFPLSQQIAEPTGYAEGWTVFTEHFVADHCRDLGRDLCILTNTNSTFCNIFIPAYVSFMVNREGWTEKDTADYLSDFGLEEAADIFYEYAVTMPDYAMPYAVGYSYFHEIYENANPRNEEQHKAFFDKYLSFGPTYMNILLDKMK